MASRSECATCWAMLSSCGFLFLVTIGTLVHVQPQFMKLGKNVTSPARIFETAALYGAIFVVSTMVLYMEHKKASDTMRYHLLPTSIDEAKPLLKNAIPAADHFEVDEEDA